MEVAFRRDGGVRLKNWNVLYYGPKLCQACVTLQIACIIILQNETTKFVFYVAV